jgi:effector-binding domain-containing protein
VKERRLWDPGLRTDGHNVFLYRHPEYRGALMDVDFGVEVTRSFEGSGEVRETDTPAGQAAVATHIGAYDRLSETHNAVHAWAVENKRTFAGYSIEIHGDWSDNPSNMETTVIYLLQPQAAGL